MDVRVKKFVNEQKCMAEKIKKTLGATEVNVKFFETFPGVRNGNCMYADNVQKVIPYSTLILEEGIMKRKLTVEMEFIFPVEKRVDLKRATDVFCNVVGTSATANPNVSMTRIKFNYNKDPQKIFA